MLNDANAILVTGAAGFIGYPLSKRLVNARRKTTEGVKWAL